MRGAAGLSAGVVREACCVIRSRICTLEANPQRTTVAIHYPDDGNALCAEIEDTSFWFQHRNDMILEVMRRYPPPQPLYDVGGGNGVVSAAMARAGIKAIVVEPGAAGVQKARERGLEAIQATLDQAGLAEGSVPSIGLFDVLEHIEDSVGFLRQAHRLMRPGGRLYIAVPAYQWLWSGEDDIAQHFRRYTARSLAGELRESLFEVEYTTYMFSFLTLPLWMLRTIPSRLGRSSSRMASRVRSDHQARGTSGLVRLFRRAELEGWRKLGRMPVGTSVCAVARRT